MPKRGGFGLGSARFDSRQFPRETAHWWLEGSQILIAPNIPQPELLDQFLTAAQFVVETPKTEIVITLAPTRELRKPLLRCLGVTDLPENPF